MIKDSDIKEAHDRILKGNKVNDEIKKLGISRAYYYQKIKEFGLSTKREIEAKNREKNITKINDMHDLATLLNVDFETVHKYVNSEKSIKANINRMNYLKLHSPIKFQEAIKITILNFYKIDAVKLANILKND